MKTTMTLVLSSVLPWNGTDPSCINFDVCEYFPVTQVVQLPPAGPEYPALQVHAVTAVLPAGEFVKDTGAVKSTPRTMASAIAEVASVLRYSSTTKTPAMSPLK